MPTPHIPQPSFERPGVPFGPDVPFISAPATRGDAYPGQTPDSYNVPVVSRPRPSPYHVGSRVVRAAAASEQGESEPAPNAAEPTIDPTVAAELASQPTQDTSPAEERPTPQTTPTPPNKPTSATPEAARPAVETIEIRGGILTINHAHPDQVAVEELTADMQAGMRVEGWADAETHKRSLYPHRTYKVDDVEHPRFFAKVTTTPPAEADEFEQSRRPGLGTDEVRRTPVVARAIASEQAQAIAAENGFSGGVTYPQPIVSLLNTQGSLEITIYPWQEGHVNDTPSSPGSPSTPSADENKRVSRTLARIDPVFRSFGIVPGDLEVYNVLVDGDKLAIVDTEQFMTDQEYQGDLRERLV